MKHLGMVIATYILFWTIIGNGIPWYGLIIWSTLPALILYQINTLKQECNYPFIHNWSFSIIGIYLVFSLFLSFTNTEETQKSQEIFHSPFISFLTTPSFNKGKVLEYYNSDSNEAIELLNAKPNKKIYMVNSSFLYHIHDNKNRIFKDNKLKHFGSRSTTYADSENFINKLYERKVGFILLDLNTASMDRTESKNLTDRYKKFLQVLTRNPRLKLLATDNYIMDPTAPELTFANGQRLRAKKGLNGKIAARGSFVLYEIN